MPIHSKTNLYPGINAHLNSFLQQEGGGWESFHAEHIIDLRRVLAAKLPAGYYATSEKSLQITPLTWFGGGITRGAKPDITILQRERFESPSSAAIRVAEPTAVYPISELMIDQEDDFIGIVVYEYKVGELPGKPVTRIELLSPTNKPPHTDYGQYRAKRQQTLESGISLVEIDYLHQTAPANPLVKNYSTGEADAYPYNITIDIPQSSLSSGRVEHYGVDVDATLPVISVPLLGNDTAALDLQDAYHRTYASEGFFDIIVDYAADPVNLDRYTPDDQMKIRALLDTIRSGDADE